MIVTASIFVSSYAGFYLLRRRLDVLSKLALRSVHLLDGLLEPGDEDEKLEALVPPCMVWRGIWSFVSSCGVLVPSYILGGSSRVRLSSVQPVRVSDRTMAACSSPTFELTGLSKNSQSTLKRAF